MTQSNTRPRVPLWQHQNGQWCKKVGGKFHYFGAIADDPHGQRAAATWYATKDELLAGNGQPTPADELTLLELCDRFLATKRAKVKGGTLTERSWLDYQANCQRVLAFFGRDKRVVDLRPDDFEQLKTHVTTTCKSPETVLSVVVRTRMIFKYGQKNGLLERPVLYGEGFEIPRAAQLRKIRIQRGKRHYTAAEIRKLIAAASVQFRAMLYLAINCAFGPCDCGKLTLAAVDLRRGWIAFPRPKTGASRRAKLWPESVKALHQWLAERPRPGKPELQELVFLRDASHSWEQGQLYMGIADEFRRTVARAGLKGHTGFYSLRRTFRQVADETADQVACDEVMGHCDLAMAGRYRDRSRISDERIERVVGHVRQWLLGSQRAKKEVTHA